MPNKAKQFLLSPLILVGCIGLAYLANQIIPIEFNRFGIRPRNLSGLIGVPASIFLHANLNHLISNIIPLFIMGLLLRSFGNKAFFNITILLTLLSGSLTWLISSSGLVIGASGLAFAYWSFLITNAIRRKTAIAIVVALATLLIYGGLIFSLASFQPGISWAGHFSGFVAGIIVALYLPKLK